VTHFEDLGVGFKPAGFFIEEDFMTTKWWPALREKRFAVNQVLLVSDKTDLADLETRLESTKDIPNYCLSCIVAPPLVWFVDLFVREGRMAQLGCSTNQATPNIDTDGLFIYDQTVAGVLANSFNATIKTKAIHVKTLEGIKEANVEKVRKIVEGMGQSRDRYLRQLIKQGYISEE